MGGTGSGRWTYHDKKTTVEECWAIGISEIARRVDLQNPGGGSGSLRPLQPATGHRMPPVRIKPKVGPEDKPVLILSYAVKDRWGFERRIEETVRLQTTRPHFGGSRHFFSCPRATDGRECGRRVGKLYRPPDQRRFACRHCLDLTYQSSQRSHRYDRLCRLVAGEGSGEAFRAAREAFSPQKKAATGRGARATPKLSEAFDEVFGKGEGR